MPRAPPALPSWGPPGAAARLAFPRPVTPEPAAPAGRAGRAGQRGDPTRDPGEPREPPVRQFGDWGACGAGWAGALQLGDCGAGVPGWVLGDDQAGAPTGAEVAACGIGAEAGVGGGAASLRWLRDRARR